MTGLGPPPAVNCIAADKTRIPSPAAAHPLFWGLVSRWRQSGSTWPRVAP